MTRKLFSLTLSAFALLLLMGAGVEEDSAGQIQTEKGPRGAQLVQASETHDQEADQAHMVTAVAGSSVLTLVEDMDRTLTVDGQARLLGGKQDSEERNDLGALVPMAKELDSSVSVVWTAAVRP